MDAINIVVEDIYYELFWLDQKLWKVLISDSRSTVCIKHNLDSDHFYSFKLKAYIKRKDIPEVGIFSDVLKIQTEKSIPGQCQIISNDQIVLENRTIETASYVLEWQLPLGCQLKGIDYKINVYNSQTMEISTKISKIPKLSLVFPVKHPVPKIIARVKAVNEIGEGSWSSPIKINIIWKQDLENEVSKEILKLRGLADKQFKVRELKDRVQKNWYCQDGALFQ